MRLSRRLVNGERNVGFCTTRDPKQRSDERLEVSNCRRFIRARSLDLQTVDRLYFIAVGADRCNCQICVRDPVFTQQVADRLLLIQKLAAFAFERHSHTEKLNHTAEVLYQQAGEYVKKTIDCSCSGASGKQIVDVDAHHDGVITVTLPV